MTTFSELLPACKTSSHRGIRWTPNESDELPHDGVLEIMDAKKVRTYLVCEIVPGPKSHVCGRAFRLVKTDGVTYDAVLHADGSHTCDCAAGCYEKVPVCCHVLAMRAIIENGWLTDPRGYVNPREPVA